MYYIFINRNITNYKNINRNINQCFWELNTWAKLDNAASRITRLGPGEDGSKLKFVFNFQQNYPIIFNYSIIFLLIELLKIMSLLIEILQIIEILIKILFLVIKCLGKAGLVASYIILVFLLVKILKRVIK